MTRRRITTRRFLGLLTCAALYAFVWPTAPAQATSKTVAENMVPHKALYSIKMKSKKSSSQILNISGQMFYEWRPVCDAWITDHKFNLYYEYADSPAMQITSDFSTYETHDGNKLDFNSRRKRNNELYQELRGTATLDENHKGEAIFKKPDGLAFDLKTDTFFPMSHTFALLDTIKSGGKFFNASVFDGSDEDGPVEINAFIGSSVNVMAQVDPTANLDTSLINTPAWNVRMAFFPLAEPYADAEYEMDTVLHENGIISDMLVEYRDFSVTQKLVAIEKIDPMSCEDAKKQPKDIPETPKINVE